MFFILLSFVFWGVYKGGLPFIVPSFPKFFIGNPKVFKYYRPRLKNCRTTDKEKARSPRRSAPRDDIMKELCTPSGSEVHYH